MLLTEEFMFQNQAQLKQTKWSLKNLDCSIELVRIIYETTQHEKSRRLIPTELENHAYFKGDIQTPTIQQMVPQLYMNKPACFEWNEVDKVVELCFDNKDQRGF